MRISGIIVAPLFVACLAACGSSSSPGLANGSGGQAGAAPGRGGAVGTGGSSTGVGGASAGQAGAGAGGGHTGAGASVGGGQAGNSGGGGGTAGSPDGGVACSPCNAAFEQFSLQCSRDPTASCTYQKADSLGTDGTETETENDCYSDGFKTIEADMTTNAGGPFLSSDSVTTTTGQLLKNGVTCATYEATETRTVSDQKLVGAVYTELLKNASGNLVATLTITITSNADGSTTDSTTITCPGQVPEPFVSCSTAATTSTNCDPGTCM